MTSKSPRTIKPQQAIEEYLSALLNPAPATQTRTLPVALAEEPPASELTPLQKEELQRTLLRSLPPTPAEVEPARPAPVPQEVAKPAPAPAQRAAEARPQPRTVRVAENAQAIQQAQVAETRPADAPPPDGWLPNGRPAWAQERFECLLFGVAGLRLAVPLICLGGIHAVKDRDELTPLPGMPDWFIGILPTVQGNLRIVDTARWVMPERDVRDYKDKMTHVIRINDSDWGLACDLVDKSFSLEPDAVRWRTQRSKRPWLAGTVVEHMCALMDMEALDRLLKESERPRRR